MKTLLIALTLVAVVPLCTGQEAYKCKINGSFVFQDRPCPGLTRYSDSMPSKTTKAESVPLVQSQPTASQSHNAASVTDLDRQKAFLAREAKDRRVFDLKYQIENTEIGILNTHAAMQNELAVLDSRRNFATNNLAGATYLESLATEKNAVTSRGESELTTLRDRLKTLREDLAKAQKDS